MYELLNRVEDRVGKFIEDNLSNKNGENIIAEVWATIDTSEPKPVIIVRLCELGKYVQVVSDRATVDPRGSGFDAYSEAYDNFLWKLKRAVLGDIPEINASFGDVKFIYPAFKQEKLAMYYGLCMMLCASIQPLMIRDTLSLIDRYGDVHLRSLAVLNGFDIKNKVGIQEANIKFQSIPTLLKKFMYVSRVHGNEASIITSNHRINKSKVNLLALASQE